MTRALLISALVLADTAAFAQDDPIIETARQAAESFAQELPNYFCRQVTTRYLSASRAMSWRRQDEISAEVVYENGKESYRNVILGGKPAKNGMQELSGAWSTGEFGSQLWELFVPSTATTFR